MWSVTKSNLEKLRTFKRKMLRCIYDSISENSKYRIKTNKKIYQMYITFNINAFIEAKYLEWTEHLWKSNSILKKIMTETIDGKRPRGRSRQGWMNTIKSDLQIINN